MKILLDIFWGYPVLLLILILGIFLSFKSKFLQVRHFHKWIKAPFQKEAENDGISPFQALSTALAGTIGTGNIIGVSLAISVGGAGSIFWMCVSAFFGMMIVFAEISMSNHYNSNGLGAIAYIKKVSKPLAFIYAIGCVLSSLAMGNMAQAKSVSTAFEDFGISKILVGICLFIILFVLSKGGIKTICNLTQTLVPIMTIFFFVISFIALFISYEKIPQAINEIFSNAFTLKAGLGGGIFLAMKVGISRGVFTNEAGLGLSAMIFSNVKNTDNLKLSYFGIFQVFIDTIVMCVITGLCVLTCTDERLGGSLVRIAFENVMGDFGFFAINLSMALFAFATMCATSYYGKVGLDYISKGKLTFIYPFLFSVFAFLGAIFPVGTVFEICDIFNSLLAIPNLIALFVLSKKFTKILYKKAEKF